MYYNMFIYIMWCGMADDMMKKEVKATMLLLVDYAYLMNRSMMDVCFLKLLTLHSLQKGLE